MALHQSEIEALVRQIVGQTLGQPPGRDTAAAAPAAAAAGSRRPLLGEEQVRQWPAGTTLEVPAGTLITPLARQVALERRITLLVQAVPAGLPQSTPAPVPGRDSTHPPPPNLVALGADHGGYPLKEQLKETLTATGYPFLDCGTHSTAAVDYPDYAYAVARLVGTGRAWRGIIIDGAGIGSCMAANKVPDVRAAMCYDHATAVNSREHNNANVLTLGAGLVGPNLAGQIVITWLATEFGGGRHARRVDKIDAIGRRFAR